MEGVKKSVVKCSIKVGGQCLEQWKLHKITLKQTTPPPYYSGGGGGGGGEGDQNHLKKKLLKLSRYFY